MHTEYLQSLRYKLQKRVRRLKSTGFVTYISVLRQFWRFFDDDSALTAIQEELRAYFPQADEIAEQIMKEGLIQADQKGALRESIDDEQRWAAVSLGVLRRFAKMEDYQWVTKVVPPQSSTQFDDYMAAFSEFYLTPLYEYVDERLDDPRFVLGQLIRFKHLCEWFWRADTFEAWTNSPARGEKLLAKKLYEFLFTEGIHVSIEPFSVSGEADMVGSQQGPERLIADAKVFNPEKSKGHGYIVQGFRQIYQYTADYNEPIGYLVIFNTSNKHLRFSVAGAADPLPRVVVNHKTIFFLVIDLYPHETSASKRPQSDVIEITEAEIIGAAASTIPKLTVAREL
jgi:hypothetical protein